MRPSSPAPSALPVMTASSMRRQQEGGRETLTLPVHSVLPATAAQAPGMPASSTRRQHEGGSRETITLPVHSVLRPATATQMPAMTAIPAQPPAMTATPPPHKRSASSASPAAASVKLAASPSGTHKPGSDKRRALLKQVLLFWKAQLNLTVRELQGSVVALVTSPESPFHGLEHHVFLRLCSVEECLQRVYQGSESFYWAVVVEPYVPVPAICQALTLLFNSATYFHTFSQMVWRAAMFGKVLQLVRLVAGIPSWGPHLHVQYRCTADRSLSVLDSLTLLAAAAGRFLDLGSAQPYTTGLHMTAEQPGGDPFILFHTCHGVAQELVDVFGEVQELLEAAADPPFYLKSASAVEEEEAAAAAAAAAAEAAAKAAAAFKEFTDGFSLTTASYHDLCGCCPWPPHPAQLQQQQQQLTADIMRRAHKQPPAQQQQQQQQQQPGVDKSRSRREAGGRGAGGADTAMVLAAQQTPARPCPSPHPPGTPPHPPASPPAAAPPHYEPQPPPSPSPSHRPVPRLLSRGLKPLVGAAIAAAIAEEAAKQAAKAAKQQARVQSQGELVPWNQELREEQRALPLMDLDLAALGGHHPSVEQQQQQRQQQQQHASSETEDRASRGQAGLPSWLSGDAAGAGAMGGPEIPPVFVGYVPPPPVLYKPLDPEPEAASVSAKRGMVPEPEPVHVVPPPSLPPPRQQQQQQQQQQQPEQRRRQRKQWGEPSAHMEAGPMAPAPEAEVAPAVASRGFFSNLLNQAAQVIAPTQPPPPPQPPQPKPPPPPHQPPAPGPAPTFPPTVAPPQAVATGTKRAVLVGCNYPGTSAELQGCVNDAYAIQELLLTPAFGFQKQNITLMLDNGDTPANRPTGANIKARVGEMVRQAQDGDVLVFHYSGHGTQVPCKQGDAAESDGKDEAICPCDMNVMIDNDLRALFQPLRDRPNVKLTFLADCCHSGTLLDHEAVQISGPKKGGPPASAASAQATQEMLAGLGAGGGQKKGLPPGERVQARSLPFNTLCHILSNNSGGSQVNTGNFQATMCSLFGQNASGSGLIQGAVGAGVSLLQGLFGGSKPAQAVGPTPSPVTPTSPAAPPKPPAPSPAPNPPPPPQPASDTLHPDVGILITGCQSNETSADVQPAGGKAHGAFTNAVVTAVQQHMKSKPGEQLTNRSLVWDIRQRLGGFTQSPSLECSNKWVDTPFICQ